MPDHTRNLARGRAKTLFGAIVWMEDTEPLRPEPESQIADHLQLKVSVSAETGRKTLHPMPKAPDYFDGQREAGKLAHTANVQLYLSPRMAVATPRLRGPLGANAIHVKHN